MAVVVATIISGFPPLTAAVMTLVVSGLGKKKMSLV
jgi:hypothetical protein